MLKSWIVQFVDKNQLEGKDEEHAIELGCGLELSVLQDVTENDNLIEKNKL